MFKFLSKVKVDDDIPLGVGIGTKEQKKIYSLIEEIPWEVFREIFLFLENKFCVRNLSFVNKLFRMIVLKRIELLTIMSCPSEEQYSHFFSYVEKLSSLKRLQTGYCSNDDLLKKILDMKSEWEGVSASFKNEEFLIKVAETTKIRHFSIFSLSFKMEKGLRVKNKTKLTLIRDPGTNVLIETLKKSPDLKKLEVCYDINNTNLVHSELESLQTTSWSKEIKFPSEMSSKLDEYLPKIKELGYYGCQGQLVSSSLETLHCKYFHEITQSIDFLPNLVHLHLFHTNFKIKNEDITHTNLRKLEVWYGNIDDLKKFSKKFPNVDTASFKNTSLKYEGLEQLPNLIDLEIHLYSLSHSVPVNLLESCKKVKKFRVMYVPKKMPRSKARKQPTQYVVFEEGFKSDSVKEIWFDMGYDRYTPIDYKVNLEKTFKNCRQLEKAVFVYPDTREQKTDIVWVGEQKDSIKEWPYKNFEASKYYY